MIQLLKNPLASRSRSEICRVIVLHSTDGASAGSSISWLRKIGLSYHFVIERDGTITKCVPVSRVAFHAGKSLGPDGPNVNEYSIGIAFANFESKNEPITTRQIEAMYSLVAELKSAMPSLEYITTHRAISPGRKTDPRMLKRTELVYVAKQNGLVVWS